MQGEVTQNFLHGLMHEDIVHGSQCIMGIKIPNAERSKNLVS